MQVASWLSELEEVQPVDRGHIAELAEVLEGAARDAVELLAAVGARQPDPGEVRMPKSRLAALGRCERSAVASWFDADGSQDVSRAALRGIAYDRFVIHQIQAGRVREPVDDLRAMLLAEAEWAALDALDQLEESGSGAAPALLDPVASTVADAWAGIDPAWMPRTQSRASLGLASSRVVCSGVVDVELGGVGTDRPGVVIEVKSGEPGAVHLAEVAFYALLLAVRDGAAPAAVARWYPGTAPAAATVTGGLLESAARRLASGITHWAELMAGRPATERPGPWCTWCPDSGTCPSAHAEQAESGG